MINKFIGLLIVFIFRRASCHKMIPLRENDVICPYDANFQLTPNGRTLHEVGENVLTSGKKLGVVILSGGEGTRLGFPDPKGLFEIEGKKLFQWHLERIENLHKKYKTEIYLFIMTSESTDEKVRNFFEEQKLPYVKEVEVFKQNSIEVRDLEKGEPMYLDGKKIKSPMGNGDFFDAIKKTKNKGEVDVFNVISVDNVMAKILDEVFIGAFYFNKLDILSKAVNAQDNESVGTFFRSGDHIKIIDYCEKENGENTSIQGNICNHLFSAELVELVGSKQLKLHEAKKKIPFTDANGTTINPEEPNGIKREEFIFDSFDYSTNNMVMNVPRELEFSPLKNGPKSKTDNSETCSAALRKGRIAIKENDMLN